MQHFVFSNRTLPSAMKFISFVRREQITPGLLLRDNVLDLPAAAKIADESMDLSSMLSIIRGGETALAVCNRLASQARDLQEALLPEAEVQLLAPIPAPVRNIFCVGLNYLDHAKEGAAVRRSELKLPEVPIFFTKATRTVVGPGAEVRLDRKVTQRLDYEIELGVVIGRSGRDIAPRSAFDYIFGYTVANDVTARDLQRRHEQWFKGKSLDTTLPLGPCIVSRDEIRNPQSLELSLSINGQERQRARVEQMIFDIPTLIASLSAGLTLEPGDIIATGTPSGVGPLAAGDVVEVVVSGVGTLRNPVQAANS